MSRDMPLRDFEHGETREYERDQTQDGFNQRGAALSRGMTTAAAGKDWHCSEVRSKLALEKRAIAHHG